jgi:membrane-associated protease RseP (regulator of RpoE activity)
MEPLQGPPTRPFGEPLIGSAPRVPPPSPRPRWALAIALLLVTFVTTTTLGAHWSLASRTEVMSPLPVGSVGVAITPTTLRMVWGDRDLLLTGLSFSLPVLLILLCHELGHYLTCRRYRIDATLPYFVPAPVGLGTFGAFIRIRSPIRNKRELFDVGVAGPFAGVLALLPFLVYGIARSPVAPIEVASGPEWQGAILLKPGASLGLELATRALHGTLPPGHALDLHPFALAAWVGMLATALNLLPLGQLDGGHLLYAVLGKHHRKVARALWVALLVAGFFWQGWLLWALIVLVLGLRHPPVWDEQQRLDAPRLALAGLALLLFVLCFMPEPIEAVPLVS